VLRVIPCISINEICVTVLRLRNKEILAMSKEARTQKPSMPQSESRSGPIMVIFHPGKGALLRDVKKQLNDLDPREERIQVFIGARSELATLISPLGIFKGRERIKDGLIALKSVMKYIV